MSTRILHVIDSLGAGGAERVVVTLAREQARRHQVAVAHLLESHDLAAELRAGGVEVFPLGVGGWGDLTRGVVRLRRLVRRLGTVVLHAHLAMATLATAVMPVSTHLRAVTFHNLGLAGGAEGGLKTRLLRAALGQLVPRRFTHLTAVSGPAADAYARELQLSVRPVVMPNPVDVDALRAGAPRSQGEARRALALPGERPVVVCVAKLTWEKNQRTLLEAIALLPRGDRPLVALVGDGPLASQLRGLSASLGLENDVLWCGARPSEEVPRWLRAASLFVLPSVSEGQPVSVLEAMALGVPVVASSVGGLPELLAARRGWLVGPGDATGLAGALSEALQNAPEREVRSRLALQAVETEYSVPVVARKWEELLAL